MESQRRNWVFGTQIAIRCVLSSFSLCKVQLGRKALVDSHANFSHCLFKLQRFFKYWLGFELDLLKTLGMLYKHPFRSCQHYKGALQNIGILYSFILLDIMREKPVVILCFTWLSQLSLSLECIYSNWHRIEYMFKPGPADHPYVKSSGSILACSWTWCRQLLVKTDWGTEQFPSVSPAHLPAASSLFSFLMQPFSVLYLPYLIYYSLLRETFYAFQETSSQVSDYSLWSKKQNTV